MLFFLIGAPLFVKGQIKMGSSNQNKNNCLRFRLIGKPLGIFFMKLPENSAAKFWICLADGLLLSTNSISHTAEKPAPSE